MSNCIGIYRSEIEFPAGTLKNKEFSEDLQKWADKEPDIMGGDEKQYYIWWFLTGNVKIIDGTVYINFGQGRSTHTFRDWEGLLYFLARHYVQSRFKFTIKMADLDWDGGDNQWYSTYELLPDGRVFEDGEDLTIKHQRIVKEVEASMVGKKITITKIEKK